MKNKWRKWQLGVGGAIAVFFMFQSVKESPAFMQATQMAKLSSHAAQNQTSLPAFDENSSQNNNNFFDDNSNQSNSFFDNNNSNNFSGQFSPTQHRSHTRTGRS